MPRPFSITLTVPPSDPIVIPGEISDTEERLLAQYVEHARELFASKAVRDGIPCNLSVRFDVAILGGTIEAHLPDDDALAVILHRLRPVILQKEAASFVNASAILGRHLNQSTIRTIIREQRDLFENSDRAQTWALTANNVRVNAENILQDWLNGLEYHTDAERRDRIQDLLGNAEVLVRYALVFMLLNKIDAVRGIMALAQLVLGTLPIVRFEPAKSGARGLVILESRNST